MSLPSRPRRILHVIADGAPGGGTTHVLVLLRRLSEAWELGLATQGDSYLVRTAQALGIECFPIEPFGGLAAWRVPAHLRRIVRSLRPDLIHAHGSRAAFLLARASPQAPVVQTLHGLHLLHRSPLARWPAVMAQRYTNRRAAFTIFVSEADFRLARERGLAPPVHQCRVIHNGIPPEGGREASAPISHHVGFLGRLEYPKDPLLFLEAMALLPDCTGEMVGGGSLEAEVHEAIRTRGTANVQARGALPHDEALRRLRRFSAMLVTSRWEGLPVGILEAMREGVPVVAPRLPGIEEVIEDGISGLLIDSRSPGELAGGVRRVMDDLRLRKRLIAGGTRRIREHFSEDEMVRSLQEVYELTLQSASRTRTLAGRRG
jgi:glycosyltransferase involved in cell wall biosynthesis